MAEKRFSVRDAAEIIGVSGSRIRQLCLEHKIGEVIGATRILSGEDIRKLQSIPRVMGRPKQAS